MENKKLIGIIWIIGIFFCGITIWNEKSEFPDKNKLKRKEYTYEEELEVKLENGEKEYFTVSVDPIKLEKAEGLAYLEEVKIQLEEVMLGENVTLEKVTEDLSFPSQIGTPEVTIDWELSSYEAVGLDGRLKQEELNEKGTLVQVYATLSYEELFTVFERTVHVFPKQVTEKDLFLQEIEEAVEKENQESIYTNFQDLPSSINGEMIVWKKTGNETVVLLIFLTAISSVAIIIGKKKEEEKQEKKRRESMILDYSQIVSKLLILMNAGLPLRKAWEKMVKDYEEVKQKPRPAYEEMKKTYYEMQSGVFEHVAYERFGNRCECTCYRRFTALLTQNLKKGTKGLTEILEVEVRQAFEEQKAMTLRKGEEATSKLLLPMGMMLLIVMAIILIPAGMSMQI